MATNLSTCSDPDHEKNGLLCYPKCKEGYYGVGPICWESCREGYDDHGNIFALISPHIHPTTFFILFVYLGVTCFRNAHVYVKECCCTIFTLNCCNNCTDEYKGNL